MRFIRSLFIIMVMLTAVIYFLYDSQFISTKSLDHITRLLNEKQTEIKDKNMPDKRAVSETFSGDLFQWMDRSAEELKEELGEPLREDLSAYGYTWWIYTDLEEQYLQFGILDGDIVTIFATGQNISAEPIQLGQSYDKLHNELSFEQEVAYSQGISSYHFQLTDEDLSSRPLVKIADNLFLQCYFDTFTDKLSSIRVLNGDVLLSHRPYQMEYRGPLEEQAELSEEEWLQVEEGMEKQIFDITNVVRNNFEQPPLEWEETVSEVAFLHSRDMEQNNYFSHDNPEGEGLKERLSEKNIAYYSAGENIAALYPDAAAAIEGWLNSEGHREALLNGDYTHLGVGVYRLYYTQNFLEIP